MERLDNDTYRELHQKWILQPTRRERVENDTVLKHNQHLSKGMQQQWNKKEIQIYFTYESGPMLTFNHELRRLWNNTIFMMVHQWIILHWRSVQALANSSLIISQEETSEIKINQ